MYQSLKMIKNKEYLIRLVQIALRYVPPKLRYILLKRLNARECKGFVLYLYRAHGDTRGGSRTTARACEVSRRHPG